VRESWFLRSLRHIISIWLPAISWATMTAASIPDSALDFEHIVAGPPEVRGVATLTAPDGSLFLVGVATLPSTIQTTPGALTIPPLPNVQPPTVFVKKFSPDGSQLLFAALIGETVLSEGFSPFVAKLDPAGNLYIAFQSNGRIAGVPNWTLSIPQQLAVVKLTPQGDRVLFASTAFSHAVDDWLAMDVDTDGSADVATFGLAGGLQTIEVAKIDPSGTWNGNSFTINETAPPGREPFTNSVGGKLALAVGPNHLVTVVAGPSYVYRVDLGGNTLVFRTIIGGDSLRFNVLESGVPMQDTYDVAVDQAGNSYVVGFISFQDGTPPFQADPVDFTQSPAGTYHGYLVKLDPQGSVIFSKVFSAPSLSQVAVSSAGKIWSAGASWTGFSILSLDSSGSTLEHYISLPAPSSLSVSSFNELTSLAVDTSGRVQLAGWTLALELPYIGPVLNEGAYTNIRNGFFIRLVANPPQANLEVRMTTAPDPVLAGSTLTVTIQITNHGPSAANHVLLNLTAPTSEVFPGQDRWFEPGLASSCQVTGLGTCTTDGEHLRIVWPTIPPGASEFCELLVAVAPTVQATTFPIGASVQTSTDNAGQVTGNVFSDGVLAQPVILSILTGGLAATLLRINDRPGYEPVLDSMGHPPIVEANSDIKIFVPSPQFPHGLLSPPYVFQSWGDGSADNPRVFHSSSSTLVIGLNMKQILAPVLYSDAPVMSAANYRADGIAPGEVVAIWGSAIGPSQPAVGPIGADGRLATTVAGMQVFFDDAPAPILYTSIAFADVEVPYSVAGKTSVQLRVVLNGQSSVSLPIPVVNSHAGLFTFNAMGVGGLAAANQDGSPNSRNNPASSGDTVILFCTGAGMTDPILADGEIVQSPHPPTLPVSITVGGMPTQVAEDGIALGQVAGVLIMKVRLPAGLPSGLLPVVLTIGTSESQHGGNLAVR
jgi:uncharacterized protein (TIGR03437 family)